MGILFSRWLVGTRHTFLLGSTGTLRRRFEDEREMVLMAISITERRSAPFILEPLKPVNNVKLFSDSIHTIPTLEQLYELRLGRKSDSL